MSNVEFQAMRVIVLAHLAFNFPIGCWGVIENEMLIVIARGVVLNPKISGGDFTVGQLWVAFDVRCIAIDAAKHEYACRCPCVSFNFLPTCSSCLAMYAAPPC